MFDVFVCVSDLFVVGVLLVVVVVGFMLLVIGFDNIFMVEVLGFLSVE